MIKITFEGNNRVVTEATPAEEEKIREILKKTGQHELFVVTAWDGAIYSPDTVPSDDVIVHERVHLERQKEHPGGPEGFLTQYVADKDFRLWEEALAFRVQYHFFCERDRRTMSRIHELARLSDALASGIYGDLCSHKYASELIGSARSHGKMSALRSKDPHHAKASRSH